MRLTENFFNRNTVVVAKDLIGKYLVRKKDGQEIAAMITETEAYCGPKDKACHAAKGRTKRTETLFGPPGSIYVYLIYGMHHCLNFVTEKEGYPAAVLIRAVENINGPGKVCRELKIDRTLNALLSVNDQLWIEDRGVKKQKFESNKRIGVDYAGAWAEKLWRFTLK